MTLVGLLWTNRFIYLLLLLIFGVFAVFLYFAIGPAAASYVGVAFAVLVLRDIGFYRRSVMLWTALQQVLDWTRIEQLAAYPGKSEVSGQ